MILPKMAKKKFFFFEHKEIFFRLGVGLGAKVTVRVMWLGLGRLGLGLGGWS